jgi:hypothetical protein
MTTMTTPQSGDVAARRDRLAQASRLIRSAQSLAEKIAELTEDELARICEERGDMVPGPIAADTTIARRLLLPCRETALRGGCAGHRGGEVVHDAGRDGAHGLVV